MLPFMHWVLAIVPLVIVIIGTRQLVLNVPMMYFVGSAIFIYPGALLQEAVLWTVHQDTAELAFVVLAISIGGVALGYGASRPLETTSPLDGTHPAKIPTRALFALLLASAAIKILLDPDTLIGHLVTGVEQPDTVLGQYLSIAVAMPTALGCLAPWLWRHRDRRTVVSALVVVAIVLVGIFGLSRTPIFYILGTIVLSAIWRARSTWRPSLYRFIGLGTLVLIAPLLIYFAAAVKGTHKLLDYTESGEIDVQSVVAYAAESRFDLATSDAYGNLLFILDNYPDEYSYLPAHSLAVLATTLIPRSVFEWKPWSSSYILTAQILGEGTFERTGTSLATSFIGELWMNGGSIAVVLGSLMLGLLGGLLTRGTFPSRPTRPRELYLMVLVMFILIPRGDLLSTLFRGVVYVAVAYLLSWALFRIYGQRYILPPAQHS